MCPRRAFTLTELLVLILLFGLLLILLIPAFVRARQGSRIDANNTRLRGIHLGFVQTAQASQQTFAGLGGDIGYLGDIDSRLASTRMWLLLKNNLLTPEWIISPLDTGKIEASIALTTANFSYALLDISPDAPNRVNEWAATANRHGAVVSDRSKAIVPPGDSLTTTSLHVTTTTIDSRDWRGGVAWNDNHVTFEFDGIMPTRYGTLNTVEDDIFVDIKGDGLMCYN